jgi:glutathione peroxidase
VRPGKGFEPKFPLLEKGNVNGEKAQEYWKFLRVTLPYSHDRTPELDMAQPYGAMTGECLWSPRTPSDLLWNFEKFLVDKQGKPRYRFSPRFPTIDLVPYIEKLLQE